MTARIVDASEPVTLVGGGEVMPGALEAALALAPRLAAADGGAAAVLAAGRMPEAVIGDLDSLPAALREQLPPGCLHEVAEQESTDFDKALRSVSAPAVIAVGFLGKRVDHQLAAFNTLVQRHATPCVLLGAQEVIFHLTHPVALPTEAGEVVSLFPMQRVRGRSEGLEWPIDGLEMSPMGRIGTSNRALGAIRLEPEGEGLLVILPQRLLADVLGQIRRDRSQG